MVHSCWALFCGASSHLVGPASYCCCGSKPVRDGWRWNMNKEHEWIRTICSVYYVRMIWVSFFFRCFEFNPFSTAVPLSDRLLVFWLVCLQNGTAVLKGFRRGVESRVIMLGPLALHSLYFGTFALKHRSTNTSARYQVPLWREI